ncbi:hypothetical protein MOQ_001327 [Trypanosoma cruzi marinkellei]|uniref:Uncharacterized protein n=1 Tax=Trypanosoma cruzi marinkellei TaxID=85056 RepID=K2NU01_TRYCR|nr:hypothetical protein MOQ_001327 [Trypanosoma cruzi marinkellei]
MFTSSDERRDKWGSLNPLQLHLKYAALRCPYDLPTEGKRHCQEGSSWLSSLFVSAGNKSLQGKDPNVPQTPQNATSIEKQEHTSKHPSLVSLACQESKELVAHSANVSLDAGVTKFTSDGTQCEEESSHKEAPQHHDDGKYDEIHSRRNEQKSPLQEFETISGTSDANKSGVIFVPNEEKKVASAVCSRNGIPRQHDPHTKTLNSCSVAVGPDEVHSKNGVGTMTPGHGDSIEFPVFSEENKMENLLATAVERLYAKLQGTALKLAPLDELNQRLVETFPQTRKGKAAEEDRAELAIQLHSLRHQVEFLTDMWNKYKAARMALERRQTRQEEATTKVIRVQIIRAYEEPPIPYKKGPFVPLAPAMQRLHLPNETKSTSISDYRSTTPVSSVLSSTRTVDSSYDSFITTEVEYLDDFEDA